MDDRINADDYEVAQSKIELGVLQMTHSVVEKLLVLLFQLSFEQWAVVHIPIYVIEAHSGGMTLSAIAQISLPMPHSGYVSVPARKPQSRARQRQSPLSQFWISLANCISLGSKAALGF